jgi:hypothetical protein
VPPFGHFSLIRFAKDGGTGSARINGGMREAS